MTESIAQFYDQLAENYHFIFADWRQSVLRQAGVLDTLIRAHKGAPPLTVLDCTCGIGTQAIGLASKGYIVHATDLSPGAVERLEREAAGFGVQLTSAVADLLKLDTEVAGTFEVVITCDNALAHFQREEDLALALRNIAAKTAPGGLFLASLRDYDRVIKDPPRSTLPQIIESPEGRIVSFQVWDWSADGRSYQLNHFTLKQHGDNWETLCGLTHLRAWQRDEINTLLQQVGLTSIHWHLPEESGYYQPIVTALKT